MDRLARELISHSNPCTQPCASSVTICNLLQLRAEQIETTKRSVVQFLEGCDMSDSAVVSHVMAFVASEKIARRQELELLERCADGDVISVLCEYAETVAQNRKLETNRLQTMLLK